MNRRFLGSLVVPVLLAAGAAVAADQPPPKNLHLVGDHWTAWDPPTGAPGPSTRIIEKGDTLWALAQKISGNPYLWPQLWERNQYIKDAHWIYPGDPLDTGVQVAPAQLASEPPAGGTTPTQDVAAAPGIGSGTGGGPTGGPSGGAGNATPGEGGEPGAATPGVLTAAAAAAAPQPLGAESDIACTGYIGDDDENFGIQISGSEYQVMAPNLRGTSSSGKQHGKYGTIDSVKVDLDPGDIVYLDSGQAAGLSAGTVLVAVQRGARVRHPLSGAVAGRFYQYQGRVRVLSVQEKTAIAEIVQSCRPLGVGSRLKLYEPEPVPLGRRTVERPVNDPVSAETLASSATILLSADGEISLGQDHTVFIDRGSDDQVTPGDVFTVYRTNREGFPPVPIGEVAVLSAQRHTALAKVIESRAPLFVGDRLQPK